jgi:hypothetical protein
MPALIGELGHLGQAEGLGLGGLFSNAPCAYKSFPNNVDKGGRGGWSRSGAYI